MNRKTVKRLFLSLVCLIPFVVHSATAEVDGITWTYTVTANGEASLGGGTTSTPAVPKDTEGSLIIPTKLNGLRVTSIGNYAFYCSSLASVTIPEGITSIGDYAFSHCTKLTSLDLPSSVIAIGGHAFEYCSSLMSWDLPEGVETIGEYAFSYNSSLRSFKLPASVTSMPFNAFTWPNTLEKLEVASGNPLYYTESNILFNKE